MNVYSVKMATRMQNIFMLAKLVSLAIIIVGGIFELGKGKTETLATGFEGSITQPGQIALAFFSGFWAYSGW